MLATASSVHIVARKSDFAQGFSTRSSFTQNSEGKLSRKTTPFLLTSTSLHRSSFSVKTHRFVKSSVEYTPETCSNFTTHLPILTRRLLKRGKSRVACVRFENNGGDEPLSKLTRFWLREGCTPGDADLISQKLLARGSSIVYDLERLHSVLGRIRLQFPGVDISSFLVTNVELLELSEHELIKRLSKKHHNEATEAFSLGSGVRLESLERVRTRSGAVNLQGRVATVVDCDVQEGSLRLASYSKCGQQSTDSAVDDDDVWYAVRVASSRYVSGQNLEVEQLSVKIPDEASQVVEILCEVESHDQGWASPSETSDGEGDSFTWGELRAVDSQGQAVGSPCRVYTNKRAEWEWQWHLSKIVPNTPFIDSLRAGMRVGLWIRSQKNGWCNYVRKAKLTIWFKS